MYRLTLSFSVSLYMLPRSCRYPALAYARKGGTPECTARAKRFCRSVSLLDAAMFPGDTVRRGPQQVLIRVGGAGDCGRREKFRIAHERLDKVGHCRFLHCGTAPELSGEKAGFVLIVAAAGSA